MKLFFVCLFASFWSHSIQNLAVIFVCWGNATTILPFKKQIFKQPPAMRFLSQRVSLWTVPMGCLQDEFYSSCGLLILSLSTIVLYKCLSSLVAICFRSVVSDQCGIQLQQKGTFAVCKTTERFWHSSALWTSCLSCLSPWRQQDHQNFCTYLPWRHTLPCSFRFFIIANFIQEYHCVNFFLKVCEEQGIFQETEKRVSLYSFSTDIRTCVPAFFFFFFHNFPS